MEQNYLSKTGKRKKEAAETSLERIRRSIEGALEKEKQNVEKEAVNRYIRDASLRMSLNLPIKPTKSLDQNHEQKNTLKGCDYKLPSLQHGDGSPIKRLPEPRMPNTENTARPNSSNTNISIDTFSPSPSKPNIRLPPIVIDTGQQEKAGKRKRKKDESSVDTKEKKKRSPDRFTSKPAKARLESVSPEEEDFNVVMCGRSPRVNQDTKELFVSKHGRFKSK